MQVYLRKSHFTVQERQSNNVGEITQTKMQSFFDRLPYILTAAEWFSFKIYFKSVSICGILGHIRYYSTTYGIVRSGERKTGIFIVETSFAFTMGACMTTWLGGSLCDRVVSSSIPPRGTLDSYLLANVNSVDPHHARLRVPTLVLTATWQPALLCWRPSWPTGSAKDINELSTK